MLLSSTASWVSKKRSEEGPALPLLGTGGHADGLGNTQIYEEGTHFMIPWFERPVIYDVRARPNVIQSTSGSRDLQMVSKLELSIIADC